MLSDEFLIMLCAAFFLLLCLLIWIDITRWRQAMDNIREEERTYFGLESFSRAVGTIQEQAKEIERLKKENANLQEAFKSYLKTLNLIGYVADKLSEERLLLEPLIPKPPATEGGE